METDPATCFQFKKETTSLEIETRIGYKIYYFSSKNYVVKSKIWNI
jgi:Icc protein